MCKVAASPQPAETLLPSLTFRQWDSSCQGLAAAAGVQAAAELDLGQRKASAGHAVLLGGRGS